MFSLFCYWLSFFYCTNIPVTCFISPLICAFVSVRLTADGAEIADEVQDIDGSCWSQDNAAGCGACGYEGAVRDFSALPPGVVSLNEYRHRR